jgi:quercetin dioxygenase-like cupin family protein
LTIASSAVTGLQGGAHAQDATPPAVDATPTGATFRALAAGSVEVLSPSTANLVMGRLSLDAGASIPFDPNDPSAILFFVSSGELTFHVNVPMTVARATGNSATPTPPEEMAADDEFTLREGDSAIFPGSMTGDVRNDGAEDASALVVDIVHIVTAEATPTP